MRMAKGSIAKKPKKSSDRMGRLAVASQNRRSYGDEPTYDRIMGWREVESAFNWYSLNCDHKDARSFLIDHLKAVGRTDDYRLVRDCSDRRVHGFVLSGCWVARMKSLGVLFEDPGYWDRMLDDGLTRLREFVGRGKDETDEDGNLVVPSEQKAYKMKRIRKSPEERFPAEQRFDLYLSVLNDAFDDLEAGRRFPFREHVNEHRLEREYVEDMLREVTVYLSSLERSAADPDEHERTKRVHETIRRQLPAFQAARTELEDILGGKGERPSKVIRRPRKSKPVSPDKLVSRMLFQREDSELGIASIDPRKLLGAQELWTYNTRYQMVTVYRAKNDNGLSVRGTTVTNFDEERSWSKKVGRRPKESVDLVMGSGKVALRKVLDSFTSKPSRPNGRINENTVMLRAL